jgi:predicted PurR-regulated permease PerM
LRYIIAMPKISRQYHLQFSDRHFAQVRRILVAVLLFALTVTIVVLLRNLITPIVISIFLAYLLAPLVEAIENRGLSRTIAVAIVFVAVFLILGLTIALLWQKMLEELQHLIAGLQIGSTEQIVEGVKVKLKAAFPGMAQSNLLDNLAEKSVLYGEAFLSRTLAGFAGIFSAIGEIIIIPFLTFFILKDSRALKKNIVQRIPNRYFEMTLSLIHKSTLQLGRFIRGQLLDATIVGIMAMFALSLLKLRYALLIGALAGMANLIPFLGPIVGGVPAVLVAIVDKGSVAAAIPVVLAFAVIKLIDDLFVQPTVVSKSVELHPVVVIIAIFAGGHVAGILGMVVAVPLVSIVKVSIDILHWGFTKYYIFHPPPYAVIEPEATVDVLSPDVVAELAAPVATLTTPPESEAKKSRPSAAATDVTKRARQSRRA